jgi:hypothetical protein
LLGFVSVLICSILQLFTPGQFRIFGILEWNIDFY